jgi:hypothetical protein
MTREQQITGSTLDQGEEVEEIAQKTHLFFQDLLIIRRPAAIPVRRL